MNEPDLIGPEDIPERQRQPLDYVPPDLRERAARLPPDRAYTVLELKPEGTGHNASLLTVAAACFRMGVDFDDTLEHLQAAYSPDRMDYETAPLRAVKRVWAAEGDIRKLTDCDSETAPDAREECLIRFRRTPTSAIVEASPGKLATKTRDVVEVLFNPDDIINVQVTALEYGTLVRMKELDAFLESNGVRLTDYKFLNPSHFKKIEGVPNPLHPERKVSTRCNENVKARPWVVLECDSGDVGQLERFNTFAMAMANFAPLVMAVDTGGKSIHFWFDASDVPAKVRTQFFNLACLHGADKRLGVKSQIARMPNVTAADVGRGPQRLVYFDPDREETPPKWDIRGFEQFIQSHQQLDYFYLGTSKTYYTRDNVGSWVGLDRTSLRSHLAAQGFRDAKADGEMVSPLDQVINSIQLDKNVEAVLPGASGRHSGVYEENGHRVIVTKSPEFVKARRGEWPTIGGFLVGLLGHQPDQLEVFYGWLSHAVKSLRNEGKRRADWSPAQMLHIAGPPNAGKTLLLQDILTPSFANRAASADPLFKQFPDMHNPDTFGCELLFLDDSPVLQTSYQFRQEFGERIKSHVVGIGGGMRGMHQARINIRPWWRFVRLMNMEPSTFATLPPLDEGVEDKLILLRGEDMQEGPLADEMRLPGWYDRVKHRIQKELPAFVHFLLHEFKLPAHLGDPKQRFPVVSFKDERIVLEVREGSPEANLLYRFDHDARQELFTDSMFADDVTKLEPWSGSAERLYETLSAVGSRGSQQRFVKTCPSPRVLIGQLRSLEKSHPERVAYSRRKGGWASKIRGREYWIVLPPDYDDRDYEATDLADLM